MSDYKFNTRCFKRWVEKEDKVFAQSTMFMQLPERDAAGTPVRKRPATSEMSSDSPMKRRFVVNDDSTSDDE